MESIISTSVPHVPWNKGKLTGQKVTAEAQGNLGHSNPPAAWGKDP